MTTAPAPSASLTLNKTATVADTNGNTVLGDAGDTITYAFAATNTGTVTLAPVTVSDPLLPSLVCSIASLAPGATASCTATGNTYVITAADGAAGSRSNTATATGDAPGSIPDPTTTGSRTVTTAPAPSASLTSIKRLTGNNDADGNGAVSLGDALTYAITVVNTGNVTLATVTITDDRITPSSITCQTLTPNATCVLTGTYVVTQVDVDAGRVLNTALVTAQPPTGGPALPPQACPIGSADPNCRPSSSVNVAGRSAIAISKSAMLTSDGGTRGVANAGDVITYAVTVRNTGNLTLTNLVVLDRFEGSAAKMLACSPTTLSPGASATCASYTYTVTQADVEAGGTLDNSVTATARSSSSGSTSVTATTVATVGIDATPTALRITKTVTPRDVKVGDLLRYTLVIENLGPNAVTDATLIDTPPAGFTYVDRSLMVSDADRAGRLVGTYPIRVDRIDIAAGGRATVVYLLRVGAGVRGGVHTNSAFVRDNGITVSNVATADVQLIADPTLDESLIVGTVFDDRDGDGWQDPARLSGVRVQGGFAGSTYVAGSSRIDRGDGEVSLPDASAPLLRGLDLGAIEGRHSDADPASARQVVISQRLTSPSFTDDFVLTTQEGLTLHMDASGAVRIELSGDARRDLTAAMPSVQRVVTQLADGVQVDYVIANTGVSERGIPGVRIASVEGLLMETDQSGRYHLVGVEGGPWERGRNFILKLDAATLPSGSRMTTDNPQVRRITPGIPVRFDFGVQLPPGLIPDLSDVPAAGPVDNQPDGR